jgi:cytochrome c peroxidase
MAVTAPYFHNGSVSELKEAKQIMGKTQLGQDLNNDQVESIERYLKALTGKKPLIEEPKEI